MRNGMDRATRRLGVVVLSLAGIGEALYMLAFRQRLIDSLACPLFGEGCEIVGRSRQSAHLGIPNAAVGLAAYAAMGLLALWGGRQSPRTATPSSLALAAVAGSAVAASGLLVLEQAFRVRAWCFWCLAAGLTNLAIFLLSLADATPAFRAVARLARRSLGQGFTGHSHTLGDTILRLYASR
jgi:uncharacterized membrane protein